jgi:hypothetical protein
MAEVRAFVFANRPEDSFETLVQEQMATDGVRAYLWFVARCDTCDDYNVFGAFDCASKAQARRLARQYFGPESVVAFGVVPGRLGLKNV